MMISAVLFQLFFAGKSQAHQWVERIECQGNNGKSTATAKWVHGKSYEVAIKESGKVIFAQNDSQLGTRDLVKGQQVIDQMTWPLGKNQGKLTIELPETDSSGKVIANEKSRKVEADLSIDDKKSKLNCLATVFIQEEPKK